MTPIAPTLMTPVSRQWLEDIVDERDALLAREKALEAALAKAERLVAVYAEIIAEVKAEEEARGMRGRG